LTVGILWALLTLAFEIALGYMIFGYSWEQIMADYNLRQGGLMPFGLAWLALSPAIAARIRGLLLHEHPQVSEQ
jgi:threonine/homoserine efflux transporter RhtA